MNKVTACKEAATALPGSTERDSTTPSMGDLMAAFDKSVSTVTSEALASATAALADSTPALALSKTAVAVSISAAEGSWPPEMRCTSCKRCMLACASRSVACAWPKPAWAAAKLARERPNWASSLAVSSSTSTWPFFTRSFTSTNTLRTVPDSSEPIFTVRVGCSVPLAETVSAKSPRLTTSVTYSGLALAAALALHQA